MPKEEVTALGYLKWIGVVQLIFGILATKKYLKSDPIRQGIVLWAWTFMIAGATAFRFRDPYASLPLSIMAAEFFYDNFLPNLNTWLNVVIKDASGKGAELFKRIVLSKKTRALIIAALILVPIAQGAYSSYKYIIPPTVKDREAFDWIRENTPPNAVFLTWWERVTSP